jgi:hypothetical protein
MYQGRFVRAVAFALTALTVAAAPVWATTDEEIDQILRAAKRKAVSVPEQARALARLAWPDEKPVDHRVCHAAREQLAGYGKHSLKALREAIATVDPVYRADVVATLQQARRRISFGIPPDLLPAFEDAVWYGSVEAQRLAMRDLAQLRFERGVLPIIDAVYANPVLLRPAVINLGRLKDARARFFLDQILRAEGDLLADPRIRPAAATALAEFLGPATAVLRGACRSDRAEVRQTAVMALVPVSGLEDLTVLHEYLGSHPDDDANVLRAVEKRARLLESLVDQVQSGEDPVVPPEF